MTIEILALVCSLTSLIVMCVAAPFAVLSYCKVVGMEKSTHKIQWVPADDIASNPTGQDLGKKLAGLYDEDDY